MNISGSQPLGRTKETNDIDMKRIKTLRAAAILCLVHCALCINVSCTQEEIDDSNTLPEGKYPLLIGSATVADDTQTRISESSVTQSAWAKNDQISVRLGNNGTACTYTYNGSKFTSTSPCYWQNMKPATVYAWYPKDGTIDLSDQSSGLKYVLKAEKTDVDFNTQPKMAFTHQLAKVRVTLKDGSSSASVSEVEVYNYQKCTHSNGNNVKGVTEGWITMHNNSGTWEANLVPTTAIPTEFIRINGNIYPNCSGITSIEAGKVYSLTILKHTKGVVIVDLSTLTADYTISDNKTYYFTGSGTHSINVTSGSPTIYLDGVNISTSSSAISIEGRGTATINVKGTSNTVKASNGAGIYVASGSTINITSDARTSNKLTATGSRGSAGIGGKTNSNNGKINISNVTISAYGGNARGALYAAGIGGAGSQNGVNSEKITITNATVYAYGTSDGTNYDAPAIGLGYYSKGTADIEITGSTIYAYRGYSKHSDYIGYAGYSYNSTTHYGTSSIIATVKSSTIYKYTGGNQHYDATNNGSVTYDANGNAQ